LVVVEHLGKEVIKMLKLPVWIVTSDSNAMWIYQTLKEAKQTIYCQKEFNLEEFELENQPTYRIFKVVGVQTVKGW
jgi:hypothetical protein